MNRNGYSRLALAAAALAVVAAPVMALASPAPNSAVLNTRIFNDCGASVLNTTNTYPGLISISDDANNDCAGFANLHNWRFSEDGANAALFANGDIFRFKATLVIDGPGQAEAGLQISPWWSQNVEGRVNIRTTDGEIACFGGVLPFYSFSGSQGLFYTKGTPITIEINYDPNSNTVGDPGTIEYKLVYGGQSYTSGVLAFNNFNPVEDPIYGSYGVMHMAQAGGHLQCLWFPGQNQEVNATWRDIQYSPDAKPTDAVPASWGKVKSLYR